MEGQSAQLSYLSRPRLSSATGLSHCRDMVQYEGKGVPQCRASMPLSEMYQPDAPLFASAERIHLDGESVEHKGSTA